MLVTLRFSKTENGTFVAHTDILRALNRTFRRSEIAINYSNGFNKHMLLKMTQPLPLGITSYAEYVTCDTPSELSKEEFLERFNKNAPPFLTADKIFVTEKNPSLASQINASKFFFRTTEAFRYKEQIEKCKEEYSFEYEHGGEIKMIDASSRIYRLNVTKEGIEALIASGNVTLRSDALAKAWNKDFNLHILLTDIIRQEQYIRTDGKELAVCQYLEFLP